MFNIYIYLKLVPEDILVAMGGKGVTKINNMEKEVLQQVQNRIKKYKLHLCKNYKKTSWNTGFSRHLLNLVQLQGESWTPTDENIKKLNKDELGNLIDFEKLKYHIKNWLKQQRQI